MQNFKKSGIINILQLKLYWNVLKLEFLYIGIKENFRYIIKNKMENKVMILSEFLFIFN